MGPNLWSWLTDNCCPLALCQSELARLHPLLSGQLERAQRPCRLDSESRVTAVLHPQPSHLTHQSLPSHSQLQGQTVPPLAARQRVPPLGPVGWWPCQPWPQLLLACLCQQQLPHQPEAAGEQPLRRPAAGEKFTLLLWHDHRQGCDMADRQTVGSLSACVSIQQLKQHGSQTKL